MKYLMICYSRIVRSNSQKDGKPYLGDAYDTVTDTTPNGVVLLCGIL